MRDGGELSQTHVHADGEEDMKLRFSRGEISRTGSRWGEGPGDKEEPRWNPWF